jgi:glycosyltransferase involved in cell wall biosynthesis
MAITVLIPVYQAEKYLSRCLDSVINQTFSFWKAIMLDDGSTDNKPSDYG